MENTSHINVICSVEKNQKLMKLQQTYASLTGE